MKTKTAILISFFIILINLINGHFFAPNGITYTPIALSAMTLVMTLGAKTLKPISLSGIITGFIILHDVGIKLYSGGTHDREGLGWIHTLLFIGLVLSYSILLFGIFKRKEAELKEKIIAALILPVAISIHLYFFTDLGLGRHYWYEWNN
ncbi:hypothetical protein [Nonlabens tegetincola]|uniref:hypothetical protein n=1 Tax=Nonlabens tegetincola TaxID=323273 RepID=UPI000CF41A2F|nr:hypothetical protein [Nonlabens tegetincola]PQJ19254.1 hypothetical protein BST93_05720 [Nonlabens tegetincola]